MAKSFAAGFSQSIRSTVALGHGALRGSGSAARSGSDAEPPSTFQYPPLSGPTRSIFPAARNLSSRYRTVDRVVPSAAAISRRLAVGCRRLFSGGSPARRNRASAARYAAENGNSRRLPWVPLPTTRVLSISPIEYYPPSGPTVKEMSTDVILDSHHEIRAWPVGDGGGGPCQCRFRAGTGHDWRIWLTAQSRHLLPLPRVSAIAYRIPYRQPEEIPGQAGAMSPVGTFPPTP